MGFTSLGFILLALFGAALVVGALNMKRLIGWEDHALTSLADAVRDYRLTLEEEQQLLEGSHSAPQPIRTRATATPARSQRGNRAA